MPKAWKRWDHEQGGHVEARMSRPRLAKITSQRRQTDKEGLGPGQNLREACCPRRPSRCPASEDCRSECPPRPPALLLPAQTAHVESSGHGAKGLRLQAGSAPQPPMRLRKARAKVILKSVHKSRLPLAGLQGGHLPTRCTVCMGAHGRALAHLDCEAGQAGPLPVPIRHHPRDTALCSHCLAPRISHQTLGKPRQVDERCQNTRTGEWGRTQPEAL